MVIQIERSQTQCCFTAATETSVIILPRRLYPALSPYNVIRRKLLQTALLHWTHTAPPASGSVCVFGYNSAVQHLSPFLLFIYFPFPKPYCDTFAPGLVQWCVKIHLQPIRRRQDTPTLTQEAGFVRKWVKNYNLATYTLHRFVLLRDPFLIKTQFNSTSSWKQDHNTWPVLSKSFVEQFPRINSCVSVSVWLKH